MMHLPRFLCNLKSPFTQWELKNLYVHWSENLKDRIKSYIQVLAWYFWKRPLIVYKIYHFDGTFMIKIIKSFLVYLPECENTSMKKKMTFMLLMIDITISYPKLTQCLLYDRQWKEEKINIISSFNIYWEF